MKTSEMKYTEGLTSSSDEFFNDTLGIGSEMMQLIKDALAVGNILYPRHFLLDAAGQLIIDMDL